METILELAKFNDVKYFDGPHKYYVGNKEYISATTFIKKFKKEFETQRLAEAYADKRGLTVESVLGDWDLKRDISTVKGTLVHDMAENWWNNKSFPYDPSESVKAFGHDIIEEKFRKCETMFHVFYEQAKENLIPVKMELVVCDHDYEIAGMVDCLFYNKKSGMLEIYDYKTNKEIKMKSVYKENFKSPISKILFKKRYNYSI